MAIPWDTKQSGFTLLELLIVVAIIGIIATIAYPNMQQQIAQMRVKDAANITETALKQARADALVYRSDVVVTAVAKAGDTPAYLKLTQVGNPNYPQTKYFNKNITGLSAGSVTFTPNKKATTESVSFCYEAISTDKYTVTLDALTNIKMGKDGIC